jgi:hypothetical protein
VHQESRLIPVAQAQYPRKFPLGGVRAQQETPGVQAYPFLSGKGLGGHAAQAQYPRGKKKFKDPRRPHAAQAQYPRGKKKF